jgi:hypothetical protein
MLPYNNDTAPAEALGSDCVGLKPSSEPPRNMLVGLLKTLFAGTSARAYVCSFSNDRDDRIGERHIATRDAAQVISFASEWDKPGRGTFFCVGTVKPGAKRNQDNIVETIGLHADIDFNKIDGNPGRDEVLRQLARLRYQPTALVFSGGGIHAYWLFKEPMETQGNIERIKLALRQLADLVAGDLAVCEVARVLRLPGTHNTKEGAWTEVEVISLDDHRRYELDDLEEWLSEASPIMLRKQRERGVTVGETDFFAEYAKQYGIKAPIDVEARLAAMMYMGGGDSSIHQTQLAVSASLLNRGVPVDEVVAILMDATRRAAGEYAPRWNWRREERNIRRMCGDWLRKHPQTELKSAKADKAVPLKSIEGGKVEMRTLESEQRQATCGGATVIQMPTQKSALTKKAEQHITLGQAVLAHIRAIGEELMNTKDGAWFYSQGIWELCSETKWLDVRIEQACVGLGFKSVTKLISEARNWIVRRPELWRKGAIPWDHHRKIPTRSGLVDPLSGELEPARPDHFCTWRVEVDYDPAAKCPWWEIMIADIFGDKPKAEQAALVRVVQEVLGAALIDKKPRALSKALVFWGIENIGKSGPLDVFSALFGPQAISAPIGSVDSTHGLMPFTRRLPWVLHEAFGGQWHFSATVKAIIKAIITHEPVMINIKNGPMITTVVRSPIFWATNFQPQFKESTRAIVSRMIVIECSRSFVEGKPIGVAAEALRRGFNKPAELINATELPGVLNWAIAGLQRALKRGSIELTDSIKETSDTIRRDSNLVAGFLDDCIEYDPMARLKIGDFCLAHSAWWMELKGEDRRMPTNEAINKALKAVGDRRVGMNRDEMRDGLSRYYYGVALNKLGLRYHRTAYESRLFEGKTATATNPDQEVNSLIPVSWDSRESVIKMRKAHAPGDQSDSPVTSSASEPEELVTDR